MGSIPGNFPISLRAWPSAQSNGQQLSMIERIHAERGGFLDLTEESLKQEIAEAEAKAASDGEDGDSTDDDEKEKEELDRTKELLLKQIELLHHLAPADAESLFALDSISLLISKDAPVQAGLTMSAELRQKVGMGTLGTDKLHASPITPEQKLDNKKIARGWKVQSLNKSVDAILASATRLEKEIETETKYWEQILAVSESGWAVCRFPTDKTILGVRFGFSEAAPLFRNRSLAPLRPNPDGSIYLDQGDAEPQCLRVRIQVGEIDTGSSDVPSAAAEDSAVEALILQARNTIFDEELWHELNREARTLGSLGIRSKGDTLICPLTSSKTMAVDLVPLSEETTIQPSTPDSSIASGLLLTLRLLLCHAHRRNHRRRTLPPPPISSAKQLNPTYALLRPLLTRLAHENTLQSIRALVAPLTRVLKSAQLYPPPTYTLTPTIRIPPPNLPTAEQTLLALTAELEATSTLNISPSFTITIAARTIYLYDLEVMSSLFRITVSDSLTQLCPSPGVVRNFDAVKEYVFYATECALASLTYVHGWEPSNWGNRVIKVMEDGMRSKLMSIKLESLAPSNIPSLSGIEKQNKGEGIKLSLQWVIQGDLPKNKQQMEKESSIGPEPQSQDTKEREIKGRREGEAAYEWFSTQSGNWGEGEGEVVRAFERVAERAGAEMVRLVMPIEQ